MIPCSIILEREPSNQDITISLQRDQLLKVEEVASGSDKVPSTNPNLLRADKAIVI